MENLYKNIQKDLYDKSEETRLDFNQILKSFEQDIYRKLEKKAEISEVNNLTSMKTELNQALVILQNKVNISEYEILKLNLSQPILLDKKGIVICLEVGEHIPKQYQEILLNNLVNNCDKYLILSWAIRGQGGYGHFNELNNDEILPLIENLGFKYLKELSGEVRMVPEDKCGYFRNTLMIFEKK